MILPYKHHKPAIDPTVYLATGAIVTGDVTIEADSTIWFIPLFAGTSLQLRLENGSTFKISRCCIKVRINRCSLKMM